MACVLWIIFVIIKSMTVPTANEKALPVYFTDDIERDCPKYDGVLPKGMCIKYLKNQRIVQTTKQMRTADDSLYGFFVLLREFLQLWFANGKPKISFIKKWLGSCYDKNYVKKLMDDAFIPSLDEVENCLNISREVVCHYKHPTCLHKPVNNSYFILQRNPCKESCDSVLSECGATFNSLAVMAKVNSYCGRLSLVRTLERIPKCKEFPVQNIQKIEQCKLMDRSGTTVITNSSLLNQNCFHGNGQSYTGKTSITISGKSCVQWNRISYLNNDVFPTLKKNYCRNPEGYGLKPWCYVNIKDRNWEYCKIKACAIENEERKGLVTNKYLAAIISGTVGGVLVVLLLVTVVYFNNKRLKTVNLEIQPYIVTPLKDSSDVVKHIGQFTEHFRATASAEKSN